MPSKGVMNARLIGIVLVSILAIIIVGFIFGFDIGSYFDFFPDYEIVDPVWEEFDGDLVTLWNSKKLDERLLGVTQDQEFKKKTEGDGNKDIIKFYKDILSATTPVKVYVFDKSKKTLVILKAYSLKKDVDPNSKTNPIELTFYTHRNSQSLSFVWDAGETELWKKGLVGNADKDDLHTCDEWMSKGFEYWESYEIGEGDDATKIYKYMDTQDFELSRRIVCTNLYEDFLKNLVSASNFGNVRITWGDEGVIRHMPGHDNEAKAANLRVKLAKGRDYYYYSWEEKTGVLVGQQIKYLCSFNGKAEQECILDKKEGKFCPTEDKEKKCFNEGGNCLCVEDYTPEYVLKYVQGNEMWDAQYSREEGKKKHCLRGAYPWVKCREFVK